MLVVCEEAHRYVPADRELGFLPTRQAIARIAKEGRKYGVSLGIITQRPGELDQTILSQCSTVFAMRLANERDQEIIRSALPDSATSTTSFLSAIGNGEAIAFGEAISVPMRMKFARVPDHILPQARATADSHSDRTPDTVDLRGVIARMRATESATDIADFQSSVLQREEEDRRQDKAAGFARMPEGSPDRPLEPYHPDMLPGARPSASAADTRLVRRGLPGYYSND